MFRKTDAKGTFENFHFFFNRVFFRGSYHSRILLVFFVNCLKEVKLCISGICSFVNAIDLPKTFSGLRSIT